MKISGTGFDLAGKKAEFAQLQEKMSSPGFWDNQEAAQGVVSRLSALKAIVEPVEEVSREVQDLAELFELAVESDPDELGQLEDDLGGACQTLRADRADGSFERAE